MLIKLTSLAILAVTVFAADHDTIRNCSRVEYCNDLRGMVPEAADQYKANLSSLSLDGGASLSLVNGNGNKLILRIDGLTNDRFRVQVEEENANRYKLKIVLDGEPEKIQLKVISSGVNITLAESENAENFVIVQPEPLNVAFYKDGILQVNIDGDKLIMQQRETSKPYSLSVTFPNAQQLYGIHEHADLLALRNTEGTGNDPYRMRNLDVAGYELDSPMSLYGSIPVLYGHGVNTTAGIFLHNAAEQWWDIRNNNGFSSTTILVETAALDLFILLGPRPKDVVRQYTSLTGRAHMPQLWTLGYHQCRWNYDNSSDVKEVIARLDSSNFPLDAIWLDIEYTDGKKYFTWNPDNFSDPIEMQQNISSTGRKLVTIIDPHIKVDENYLVYTGAKNQSLFVKNANGSDFEGTCWPGLSSYMDFLNPAARTYYASNYHYENFVGSTETLSGIWNDMNEPSVFDDSLEKTLPGDATHVDDDGTLVQHRDIHNIYGLMHTMSTHQGLLERDNNTKRPFILTRSHFAGSQRYSAFWTGDNDASWGHLKVSYSQCLNSNMLGLVFCGSDIGGFTNIPSEELLQRWYQAATWIPFYRQHANSGTPRREPYLFSEEVQNVIRNTMNLRYKHIPVWYTLFFEHVSNGDPVIRPLLYQYPSDENVMLIDDQLLVGKDILVKAVQEPEVTNVTVYFPNDIWYSTNDVEIAVGPYSGYINVDINAIPVYYRGGGLIPRKDIIRKSTSEMVDDCYTLYCNLNTNLTCTGTLYLDDNTSFNYQENDYNYVRLDYDNKNRRLKVTPKNKQQKGIYPIEICTLLVNKAPEITEGFGTYTTEVYDTTMQGRKLNSIRIDGTTETIMQF